MPKSGALVYEIESPEDAGFNSCINLISKSVPRERHSPRHKFLETLQGKANKSLGGDNYHI